MIKLYNFFRNLFGSVGFRVIREGKGFGGGWDFDDMFKEFDEMRKEAERAFSEQFKNIGMKGTKICN